VVFCCNAYGHRHVYDYVQGRVLGWPAASTAGPALYAISRDPSVGLSPLYQSFWLIAVFFWMVNITGWLRGFFSHVQDLR
jgi:hypothetical protein